LSSSLLVDLLVSLSRFVYAAVSVVVKSDPVEEFCPLAFAFVDFFVYSFRLPPDIYPAKAHVPSQACFSRENEV
jgi:hypothetical protein